MNLVVFLTYVLFFIFFQVATIYGGDGGDLVTAAATGGIAHPPGYPLYSFIGYIFSQIPLSTPAWRVGLLSSIPAAGALTFIFALLRKMTHRILPALAASTMLGVTYVFWLYGIVPEVFALNSLFTTALLYFGYSYYKEPSMRTAYILCFIAGLSLTHHHIIVFTFPVLVFIAYTHRSKISQIPLRQKAICVLLFLLGLTPYVWAYIAAIRQPPLLWNNPKTLENMIRLITRADYGSFQSGIDYGQHIRSRLLQFPFIFELYKTDFTIFGLILWLIGMAALFIRDKKLFTIFGGGFILTGPIFFFYGSYLFDTSFRIATAERFLLPSYIFGTIIIGYGMSYALDLAEKRTELKKILTGALLGLFFIVPLMLFYINYPKLSILKNDITAERLGIDLLQSVPKNSILFLTGDHAVFNTQYVHYVLGYRNDVPIFHTNRFLSQNLNEHIRKYYPHLEIPDTDDPPEFIRSFIDAHYARYPIYATFPFAIGYETPVLPSDIPDEVQSEEEYQWVPIGLVYRLYKTDDVPSYSDISVMNDYVFSLYQNPLDGSLSQYRNLMLDNIRLYYRNANVRSGIFATQYSDDYDTAIKHFEDARTLDNTYETTLYFLADTYIDIGECDNAQQIIEQAYELQIQPDEELYTAANLRLYEECLNDTEAAEQWRKRLRDLEQKKIRPLEEL